MGDNMKAWVWLANDFADGQSKVEKFAVRFKDVETATAFSESFGDCAMMANGDALDETSMTSSTTTSAHNLIQQAEKMKSELNFFKDKFSEPSKVDLENTFTEGLDVSGTPLPRSGTQKMQDFMNLTPMVQKHMQDKKKQEEKEDNSVQDGDNSVQDGNNSVQELFDGENDKSTCEIKQADVSQTGEEIETILFQIRAKLFLYDREKKEWKDRGVGNVKLTQSQQNYKPRLVMHRDQVLKVCLNQFVSYKDAIKLADMQGSEKAVTWVNQDFSDEEKPEGELLQLALRFKTIEIKDTFVKTLENAQNCEREDKMAEKSQYTEAQKAKEPTPDTVEAAENQKSEEKISETPKQPSNPFALGSSNFNFGQQNTPPKFKLFGSAQNEQPSFGSFSLGGLSPAIGGFSLKPSSITPASGDVLSPKSSSTKFANADSTNNSSDDDSDSDDDVILVYADEPTPSQAERATKLQFAPTFFIKIDQIQSPGPEFDVEEDNILDKMRIRDGMESWSSGDVTTNSTSSTSASDTSLDTTKPLTGQNTDSFGFASLESNASPAATNEKPAFGSSNHVFGSVANNMPPFGSLSASANTTFGSFAKSTTNDQKNVFGSVAKEQPTFGSLSNQNATFGSVAGTTVAEVTTSKEHSTFGSLSNQNATFGSVAKEQPTFGSVAGNLSSFASLAGSKTENNKFGFGTRNDSHIFNVSQKDTVLFGGVANDNDANEEGGNDDVVIETKEDLPPLVEVATGEEGEELLFKSRAKLYRFDNNVNEWKERGLGEYKISYNEEYNIYRVVMRREQVLKVCANHTIMADMKMMRSGEKRCMYVANDRSDEQEGKSEKLLVSFKYKETADEMLEVVKSIQEKLNQ